MFLKDGKKQGLTPRFPDAVVVDLLGDQIADVFRNDTHDQFPSEAVSALAGKSSCRADMNSSSCNSGR